MTESVFNNWHKSSRSDEGNCVEVSSSDDGTLVGVRDTKDRNGHHLRFDRQSWDSFIDGVRDGQFDL
ncbi:DUF397 domain-containing protein [Actinoplanes sp. CA-054009]